MSTSQIVFLAVLWVVVVAAAVAWQWMRRREHARRWLEAIALNIGLKRKPAETDEELRARCRAVMSPTIGPTKEGLTKIAVGVAIRYGLPAAVSIDRERGLVSVRVFGTPSAPDLVAIERKIADHLPMTIALEVLAVPS